MVKLPDIQGTLYDGPYDEPVAVKMRPEWDAETRSFVNVWTMEQREDYYRQARAGNSDPEPLSMLDDQGAFLVSKSAPSDLGCGVLQWTRRHRPLPLARTMIEPYTHAYQQVVGGENVQILEIALPVTSKVIWEYEHIVIPNYTGIPGFPEDANETIAFFLGVAAPGVTLRHAYRFSQTGNLIYTIGTPPGEDDEYILAEDQTLTQVEGNIFRRQTRMVPSLTLASYT